MLDVGWSELMLIGVVALIVIGPEDLPKLFHTLGRLTARARGMAREFTSAMEDAAKGSGLDDAAKGMKDLSSVGSRNNRGLQALDRAVTRFEKWDPKTAAATRAQPDPAAPAAPGTAAAAAGVAATVGASGKPKAAAPVLPSISPATARVVPAAARAPATTPAARPAANGTQPPADAAVAANVAHPALAPVPDPATPDPAAAETTTPIPPQDSRRRIAGVRRSDMKDL